MEEQNNNKRVLSIELENDVKKVSITGKNGDEKVVMRQELSEEDLDIVAGGMCHTDCIVCTSVRKYNYCPKNK